MDSETKWVPQSRFVYQPRFADAEKTIIKAIVKNPDGRFVEMQGKREETHTALIRDVFCQFTLEDIERFTRAEAELLEAKKKIDERTSEDTARKNDLQVTFHAKARALEIPEVKNCPDPRVVTKIRKAKSAFEVGAWVSVALLKSLEE